jgi:hypothetical protein
VSETVIAAVLLLHERSVDEIVDKLGAVELEQVIKLVGRSPRIYPPGTLDALKQRKTLVSPQPSDSVPSNISAKKQAWRPQHSADWPRVPLDAKTVEESPLAIHLAARAWASFAIERAFLCR